MIGRIYSELKNLSGRRFFFRTKKIIGAKKELERTTELSQEYANIDFAKRVLSVQEIQSNNSIEGYSDTATDILSTIKHSECIKPDSKQIRILNLYKSYQYILSHKQISKDSLSELYKTISDGLLSEEDKKAMQNGYRNGEVFIFNSTKYGNIPDRGVPASKIDEFLDAYFQFLNREYDVSKTDDFIISQILHLYFVYIHPYVDINGRTSRTLAIWYLLNKKAYEYVIFNRGIYFNRNKYLSTVNIATRTCDMSYFIECMLKTVEIELEKEYLLACIGGQITEKMDITDYQTLLELLSLKAEKTVENFELLHNRRYGAINKNNRPLDSLLDKEILDIGKDKILRLRQFDVDPERIRNLHL